MAIATKRVFFGVAAFLIFIGFVALLAVFGVNAIRAVQRHRLDFADGTRLILVSALPQGQPFSTEKAWQKPLRGILPYRWQSWIPGPMMCSAGGNTNDVVVWFKLIDAKGANVSSSPWSWCCAASENGFRYPVASGGGSCSSGTITVHDLILTAFPRRQKTFELQFFDGRMRLLGSVRVANPIKGPFAQWRPEPLPITRTNGPLVVRLEGVTEHSNRFAPYGETISPKWKLETSDPLWQGAKPTSQEWFDATGNRGGALAHDEHAWKLQLPFRRPKAENYLSDEKFTLDKVKIPLAGTVEVLTNEFERLGVQFSIRCLAGLGTLLISNHTNFRMTSATASGSTGWSTSSDGKVTLETLSTPKPFFLVDTINTTELDQLRFRVLDQTGKDLSAAPENYYSGSSGKSTYRVTFEGTNTDSPICLEAIVSRARLFEFIVDPAEVRPSK